MAAFFRAQTLILARISYLITIAYFLLVNPEKVYTHTFVLALGSGLSPETGAGAEGLIAVLLLVQAADDIMRLTGPQVLHNFMHVLPVRLVVLMLATGTCYIFKYGPLAKTTTFAIIFYDTLLTGLSFAIVKEELNERNKEIVRESRGFVDHL